MSREPDPLVVPGAETPGQPACDFRPSKPPWPSQMCATCGDWRENHVTERSDG